MEDIAFNPDQSLEETRALRQKYRTATKKIDVNAADVTSNSLIGAIEQVNTLFEMVKQPKEASLDANFLHVASTLGAQKARAMKSGTGTFELDEFITKLVSFMGENKSLEDQLPDDSDQEDDIHTPLHWERIGEKAMGCTRRVPVIGFMLGPLATEQKKRGPIKRSKLEKNKSDAKKPVELKEEDIQRSANETSKNVAVLETILSELGEPVNLFKFVINPKDFAQSVENIFYLSFLIRDGKVALDTVDGEPLIYLCEQPKDEDYREGLKKQQMVLEFDMATWEKAINVFDIRNTMIPHRERAQTKLAGKWVG